MKYWGIQQPKPLVLILNALCYYAIMDEKFAERVETIGAIIFFKYGAMNSGKTIEILKVAHNYEEQNKPVIIMTSGVDTRAGVGKVSSRIGLEREAVPIYKTDNVYDKVKGINAHANCVLIDEAQFLTKENVFQLAKIVDDLHIPVMAFG